MAPEFSRVLASSCAAVDGFRLLSWPCPLLRISLCLRAWLALGILHRLQLYGLVNALAPCPASIPRSF